ncbi:MAG: hypothetical protein JWO38_3186 [Gemmataceae bacterium]|nr:hypothetical protein [Gemmataceae bacterium]
MTYSVVWKLTAIQQLNQITADAADPRAVAQAAAFADYALRRDPHNMGESRSVNTRLWYWDVLGVYFTVDDAKMTVTVLMVGPARRH